MKWRTLIAVGVTALLIAGAVFLPGQFLSWQERGLYAEKVSVDVQYSLFEVTDSTLVQRLNAMISAGGTALDFSVGAELYWDEEALMERFQEELDALGKLHPSMDTLAQWMRQLRETPASNGNIVSVPSDLAYLCVVDPSTGNTYFLASLTWSLPESNLTLELDPISGKIVSVHAYGEYLSQEIVPSYWELADIFSQYLELENTGCIYADDSTGVFLLQSSSGETVSVACQLYDPWSIAFFPESASGYEEG